MYKSQFSESNVSKIYDSFKQKNAPFINVLDRNGNEKTIPADEAYTEEFMTKSEVTGRLLRWVAIKDGKAMSLFSAYNVKPSYGKSSDMQKKSLQKVLLKMSREELKMLYNTIDFSVFSDWNDFMKRGGKIPCRCGKDDDLIEASFYLSGNKKDPTEKPSSILLNIARDYFKKEGKL